MKKHPGRKPVDLIAASTRPEGRQIIWEAIRKLRRFTISDLEHETRIKEATIRNYVIGLELAGYLISENEKRSPNPSNHYTKTIRTLVKDVGIEAPRVTRAGKQVTQGQGRENMWRGINVLKGFNASDLVGVASVGGIQISLGEAKHYLLYLAKAGYIKVTVPSKNNIQTYYQLVPGKYTGPKSPMIQRVKRVFDPNLGAVVWPKGEEQ